MNCVSARLSLVLFLAALLTACASDSFKGIKDFVTTPIVPSSKDQPATSSGQAPAAGRDLCDKMEFATPMDVDSAYARAMRNFGFRTMEERKRFAEQNSIGMIDQNFRHTAQPGAMYRMTDYNNVVGSDKKFRAWTSMEIWRESSQQSLVKIDFCALRTDGSDETRMLLRKAYREAFK